MSELQHEERPVALFERLTLWSNSVEVGKRRFGDANSSLKPDVRPLRGVRATVQQQQVKSGLFPRYKVWLTVSGPGFEWSVFSQLNPGMAHNFADKLNAAASRLDGPAGSTGEDVVSKLAKLAELRAAGMLTDEEFTTAKTRLLDGRGESGQGALV
jgi:Short C-terminal domain